jgi:hypothetical protein
LKIELKEKFLIKYSTKKKLCHKIEKRMSEIMDIRMQHHLAQEFYRQQMLQRIPGNSSSFPKNPKKIIIDETHHSR